MLLERLGLERPGLRLLSEVLRPKSYLDLLLRRLPIISQLDVFPPSLRKA